MRLPRLDEALCDASHPFEAGGVSSCGHDEPPCRAEGEELEIRFTRGAVDQDQVVVIGSFDEFGEWAGENIGDVGAAAVPGQE